MTRDDRVNNLLSQIIEHAEVEDVHRKNEKIQQGKGEDAVGESWVVFHLKILKKLLNEEEEKEE